MAYPVRDFAAHDTWFITSRCFQARMLMTPHTPLVREVSGGVLAHALEKYGVKLFGYSFLSNHFHLVIGAQGAVIADFMQYLLANLSKKLGRLVKGGWRGRFWERRYSAEPILDEPALEGMVRYAVAHGVKEGLVARAEDWEGLHCAAQLRDGQPRVFRWHDWTRRWNARRAEGAKEESRWGEKFSKPVTLLLTPLPQWERLSCDARRARATKILREVDAKHAQKRVLGVEAVRAQSTSRPKSPKQTPRPHCHASSEHAHAQYRSQYAAFLEAYRAASRQWRAGHAHAEFPAGSFRPGTRCRVRDKGDVRSV